MAQLTRKISPPSAIALLFAVGDAGLRRDRVVYLSSGTDGPGAEWGDEGRRARRSASSVNLTLSDWAPARSARPAACGRCRPGSRRRRHRRRRARDRDCGALGADAVAAGAVGDEEVLALGHRSRRPRRRGVGLLGGEEGVGASGEQQAQQDEHDDRGGVSAAGGQGVHDGILSSVVAGARDRAAVVLGGQTTQEVDRGEEGDPHDVDEVPVVRRHDGADRVAWVYRRVVKVRRDDEEEGDEAAGDVEAVEAGRHVEHRAVGVGGQGRAARGRARRTP